MSKIVSPGFKGAHFFTDSTMSFRSRIMDSLMPERYQYLRYIFSGGYCSKSWSRPEPLPMPTFREEVSPSLGLSTKSETYWTPKSMTSMSGEPSILQVLISIESFPLNCPRKEGCPVKADKSYQIYRGMINCFSNCLYEITGSPFFMSSTRTGRSKIPKTLVIVPTYNEIENLQNMYDRIVKAHGGVDILIVDDGSPDGTGKLAD